MAEDATLDATNTGEQPGTGEPSTNEGDGVSAAPKPKVVDGSTLVGDAGAGDGEPKGEPNPPIEEEPIKYDFKLPDGFEMDDERLEGFVAMAKEAKLPQEAAQKLVDLHTQAITDVQNQVQKKITDTMVGWRDEVLSDAEIGGDKLKASVMPAVAEARDFFGNDAFKKMIQDTGVGNHPEMVRFMYKVGLAMKEGDFVSGNPGSQQNKDAASVLYGGTS